MKKSRLQEIVREEIINRLRETTIVDKTTDPNKAMDIARRDKKDVNTVKQAIQTAKTSGKAVNIDEDKEKFKGNWGKWNISPKLLTWLKTQGVKLTGQDLLFPMDIS